MFWGYFWTYPVITGNLRIFFIFMAYPVLYGKEVKLSFKYYLRLRVTTRREYCCKNSTEVHAFLAWNFKVMDQPDHVTRYLSYQNFQFVQPHFCKKWEDKLQIVDSNKWNSPRQTCLVLNVYNYKISFFQKNCFIIIINIYDQTDLC